MVSPLCDTGSVARARSGTAAIATNAKPTAARPTENDIDTLRTPYTTTTLPAPAYRRTVRVDCKLVNEVQSHGARRASAASAKVGAQWNAAQTVLNSRQIPGNSQRPISNF
jgi:hypothetical protein